MTDRRFLVLHGWTNRRPPEHWEWQLTETLRAAGEQVLYPQLPDPDVPSLATWTEVLHAELGMLGDDERVVITHSLSSILWLHAVAELPAALRVSRVLLVSPPGLDQLAEHDEVADFAAVVPDAAAVRAAAGSTRIVCGDDDEWCPDGAQNHFATLGLDADVIPGGGHLNVDAGYGPWASMLAWCRDPSVRIVGNQAG